MSTEGKHQSARAAADLEARSQSFESGAESVCPQCHHANEDCASFCAECGAALQQLARCPKCNAIARPRADICETCGTWLLKGQCMFCYAHIADDEAFCGECGSPSKGIVCQRCGKLSIFDFCKSCGIPLSIQAKDMAQDTAQDPNFKEMVSLFELLTSSYDLATVTTNASTYFEADSKTISSPQDDHVLRLKAYRETSHEFVTEPKPKSVPKALFSVEQKARISQLNEEVLQEEERRRIEEERRRQKEERRREQERRLQKQLNESMYRLRGKTFSSNQEARRFFMNIIAGLPETVAKKIINRGMAWRCNAYDCVHNSPSDCADPSRGGVWLIR